MFNGGWAFRFDPGAGRMPKLDRGTFRLDYEESGGGGERMALVHGSWGDRHQWDPAAAKLAASYRVISYDRRGHGASPIARETVSLAEQVSDLSELISMVGRGALHVVATGTGATIALRLALLRPEQVLSLNLHEPTLAGLLEGDPTAVRAFQTLTELDASVVSRLRAGDRLGAAQAFVNGAAAEPGGWAQLPPASQASFVQNAPATLRELEDAALRQMELLPFATHREPIVLTGGSRSAQGFAAINEHVATGFYHALRYSFEGAGHFPHITHPDQFAVVAGEFCRFASQHATG
ncbi:MAG: alpha/beta hydrolase [Thermoplasmata archaeon]|nr:alpha/beta hydrolase [Thermoplasmata archaeon]